MPAPSSHSGVFILSASCLIPASVSPFPSGTPSANSTTACVIRRSLSGSEVTVGVATQMNSEFGKTLARAGIVSSSSSGGAGRDADDDDEAEADAEEEEDDAAKEEEEEKEEDEAAGGRCCVSCADDEGVSRKVRDGSA